MREVPEPEGGTGKGKPIGRRVVLGMAGIGALGVVFGAPVDGWVADVLQPLSSGTGSGIADLIPGSDYFQLYTVTSGFPEVPPDYHLVVDGLVDKSLSLTVADLEAMPATKLVRDFQCVTGWRVPGVHWTGVKLGYLLDQAGVAPEGKAVFFESFDGVYTESLTMDQARLPDVIIAYQMLGAPVTRPHGGPVRLYIPEMYGYKSIKWLSKISVTAVEDGGYWEQYGYDLNAWIGRSNGRDDAPVT
ncbi:MAG: molybdopterin-dependent oxidoreductase [Acidimicrobiales bacterium]|jgi:DMSO/TMAO reductase YedYZ molybdopterin-dependent catalytic subunit